jgi:hypothetical protein
MQGCRPHDYYLFSLVKKLKYIIQGEDMEGGTTQVDKNVTKGYDNLGLPEKGLEICPQ